MHWALHISQFWNEICIRRYAFTGNKKDKLPSFEMKHASGNMHLLAIKKDKLPSFEMKYASGNMHLLAIKKDKLPSFEMKYASGNIASGLLRPQFCIHNLLVSPLLPRIFNENNTASRRFLASYDNSEREKMSAIKKWPFWTGMMHMKWYCMELHWYYTVILGDWRNTGAGLKENLTKLAGGWDQNILKC